VLTTARSWGEFWHHTGERRARRNEILRDRDVYDYTYVDWLFGPTARTAADQAPMFPGGSVVTG
jgi:hypothetical protein